MSEKRDDEMGLAETVLDARAAGRQPHVMAVAKEGDRRIAALRASLAQAEERASVLGTIITRTAKGLRLDAQDTKLTVEHLRGLCRGIADGVELAMADAPPAAPAAPLRRCQVIEADFEKGTVTFALPAGHSIGACIDVAVYERDGRPSLTEARMPGKG